MDKLVKSLQNNQVTDPYKEHLLKDESEEIGEIADIVDKRFENNVINNMTDNNTDNNTNNNTNNEYNILNDSEDADNDISLSQKFKRFLTLCTCNLFDNAFAFI